MRASGQPLSPGCAAAAATQRSAAPKPRRAPRASPVPLPFCLQPQQSELITWPPSRPPRMAHRYTLRSSSSRALRLPHLPEGVLACIAEKLVHKADRRARRLAPAARTADRSPAPLPPSLAITLPPRPPFHWPTDAPCTAAVCAESAWGAPAARCGRLRCTGSAATPSPSVSPSPTPTAEHTVWLGRISGGLSCMLSCIGALLPCPALHSPHCVTPRACSASQTH